MAHSTDPTTSAESQPAPPPPRFVTTTVEVEGREETKVVEMPAFEPEPWGEDAELRHVGRAVPRVDAREKVTGRARYAADIRLAGMLHAVLVRSPHARARIRSIDLAPALAAPGVIDAIASADLPRRIRVSGVNLFDPDATYAGQPVAAICAESEEAARRAAELVRIEWEVLPHAVTFDDATRAGAPAVRAGSRPGADGAPPSNLWRGSPDVCARGDVERGLAEADVVVSREYRTPSALHTALEPHGAVAEWEGERVTVWESTQGIFRVRGELARGLDLPVSSVRVVKDHMGGGFGAKNNAGAHTFAAAILARRTGRPVRCVNDREGEQMDGGHRAPSVQRVTIGARRDGRLTAIVCEADIPLGVGGWEASPTKIYHELYSCPNVRTTDTFAYVNGQAMQSFRAPGHVEGAFGLESAMDALARELGMDPLELRRLNFAARDEEKDRPFSSNRLLECYEEGARRFGWGERRGGGGGEGMVVEDGADGAMMMSGGGPRAAEGSAPMGSPPTGSPPTPTPRSASRLPTPPSSLRRGVGMAAQCWPAGGGPPAYALVRLNPDGTADALTGTQDLGTGARTVLAQIAADALGARLDAVRVVLGDTERTPYTPNSWGSMTTASVGPAVRMAAEDARAQLLEAAAQILGADASALRAADGVVTAADGRTISFAQIAQRLGNVMIVGRGSRGPNPDGVALMTFGAQFAEVEVDVETGVVRVLRIVAVHDAGRIVNPLLAASQIEGGILQGLGFALFEERVLDARLGVPLNVGAHDYKVPTMADVPAIEVAFIDGADTTANHTGARGLAEPPIIPTAPAIANAVADAIGAEMRELPLTPWRVLGALRP